MPSEVVGPRGLPPARADVLLLQPFVLMSGPSPARRLVFTFIEFTSPLGLPWELVREE
jgi:hypothetical protein